MRLTASESISTWRCPSCDAVATSSFCPSCGERRMLNADLGERRARGRQASWFGRLHESLRTLASPPGCLTADRVHGRRVPYISPLPLFLWTNVAFFVVQGLSGLGIFSWPLRVYLRQDFFGPLSSHLLALHRPVDSGAGSSFAQVFDAVESVHAKSLVILMVPAFAVALRLLLADRRVAFPGA